MSWQVIPESTVPQCGNCGVPQGSGIVLFFIPGGWGWADDNQDGMVGLCLRCGKEDEQYRDRFTAHFGDVQLVRDGDSGASQEAARPAAG